ncbi:MAG: glycoside hydrolase family 172 protein [Bacteroidota bacterium]
MQFKRLLLCLAVLPCTLMLNAQSDKPVVTGTPVIGIDILTRLDLLPQIRTQVYTGMFSSYDRTGGNNDGFDGTYSFIRKEGDDLVIAEMEGPGVVYRMHMPGPQDGIMEFYFDGEKSPRISMDIHDMVDGKHFPFLAPLVGGGVGGRYCYVPLTYQKSCKIIVKAPIFCFYDINYATYPKETVIPTFQNPPSDEWLKKVERAGRIINATGTDITKYLVSEGTPIEIRKVSKQVKPGVETELFRLKKPGRIVGLKIGPASLFTGKDRDIVLNIYWDNNPKPAVSSPVGDFFGYSFGDPAVKSLFIGTSDDMNYVYLPMPFRESARIELVNERKSTEPVQVQAEIEYAMAGKQPTEGYFYAYWHRENPCTEGKPFTYLNTKGNGHVIGVILQSQGKNPGGTPFFEGDDIVIMDGAMGIHGTGSEDSFNGGWYDVPARWEERASFPLSGCLDYKKYISRTGAYRWMIPDAYVFRQSIDYTIEHGPEGNLENTDYTSVTFFYSAGQPSVDLSLPEVAARRISDPDKVVFVPGWNVPIHSWSLSNATLEKRSDKVGNGRIRYLSMKATGTEPFGPHQISFIFDLPAAGKYRVSVKTIMGPDLGIMQMYQHDSPLGEPADLYSEELMASPVILMGTVDATEGDNVIYFQIAGQNPKSTGAGMSFREIIFDKE